jgi:hypothetical protein
MAQPPIAGAAGDFYPSSMTVAVLDTHRIVKRLRDAGLPEAHAEVRTDILRETRELDLSQLATKADVAALKGELRSDFAELRAELKGDLAALRADLNGDSEALRGELRGDIAALRAELKADIEALRGEMKLLEQRMTIKLGGMLIAAVAVVGALLRLVPAG